MDDTGQEKAMLTYLVNDGTLWSLPPSTRLVPFKAPKALEVLHWIYLPKGSTKPELQSLLLDDSTAPPCGRAASV